mgnify:CR=1 FL=1
MSLIEVKVPDIGDFSDVPVIELFVKVGDTIKVDDAIATLESDKATMDVPSSAAGVVKEVLVQLGSKVSEGSVLIKVESGAGASAPAAAAAAAPVSGPTVPLADGAPAPTPPVVVAAAPAAAAAPSAVSLPLHGPSRRRSTSPIPGSRPTSGSTIAANLNGPWPRLLCCLQASGMCSSCERSKA